MDSITTLDLMCTRRRSPSMKVLSKARQHLGGFLLRHGKIYSGVRTWTQAYRRWLTTVRFDHPAQQIVLQDYIDAVTNAERRVDRLTLQITEHLPSWSMAPVATANPGDARCRFDQRGYDRGRGRRL